MAMYVWNNLDEAALYLGLERLDGETNDEFVSRTKQFARWRYKTDYYTQVHSIPLQLGLKTEIIARITNSNKFICDIDWEYFTLKEILQDNTVGEYIRVFIGGKDCTLRKIYDAVNTSSTFLFNVYNEADKDTPIEYIVRNRNVILANTIVEGKYSYLDKADIVPGSIRVDNPAYRREVYAASDLKRDGEFFVDYKLGFIQTYALVPTAANIYFTYYDPTFAIEKTELSLTPLNKLFKYGITDDCIELIPDILNNLVPTS